MHREPDKFSHIFAGKNALIGLVPVKNILLLSALRYFYHIAQLRGPRYIGVLEPPDGFVHTSPWPGSTEN
jgi:hypothetical protein